MDFAAMQDLYVASFHLFSGFLYFDDPPRRQPFPAIYKAA
jgi:hypothetical protein